MSGAHHVRGRCYAISLNPQSNLQRDRDYTQLQFPGRKLKLRFIK